MPHHQDLGPSGVGTVLLDVGADTGALIVYTGPGCHLREIEISPVPDDGSPRVHAAVRERLLPDGKLYCAVYDGLPAGRYTVWRDDRMPAGSVTITAATVTEFQFD